MPVSRFRDRRRGEPTEKIADKEQFHYADALRYIMTYTMGGEGKWGKVEPPSREDRSLIDQLPRGVFYLDDDPCDGERPYADERM